MNARTPRSRAMAGQSPRAPLAAHPLFPVIVSLWLAALLAIGGMAVPASLLERAVAVLHLDQLVPAARPPLGFTARLLVAFGLALAGLGCGYALAALLRRRAERRPHHAPAPAESASTASPTDLSTADAESLAEPATAGDEPAEDEDFARLDAARTPPGRRRALTTETAGGDYAGGGASILEISALPALEPLNAGPAPREPGKAPAERQPAPTQPAPTQAAPLPEPDSAPRFRGLAEFSSEAAMRLCTAPLETLGVIELAERFALALKARCHREANPPEPRFEATPAPAHPLAFTPPRPFGEPGESRAPAPSGRPFDLPDDPAETAAGESRPAAPAAAPDSPLLMRRAPNAADLADPTAEIARWTLPEPDGEGEDIDEDLLPDPAAAPGYGSLMGMRAPARVSPSPADFVRVDDTSELADPAIGPQPVVVFPGQAMPAPPLPIRLPGVDGAAGPADTEQALREALGALKRMSGAA